MEARPTLRPACRPTHTVTSVPAPIVFTVLLPVFIVVLFHVCLPHFIPSLFVSQHSADISLVILYLAILVAALYPFFQVDSHIAHHADILRSLHVIL